MPVIEAKWGIAHEVQQGIESGRLYPDAGVIRDAKTGRIVQLIQQAHAEQDTGGECLRTLVPLVLHVPLDSRVLEVEAQLRTLARDIVQRSAHVQVADAPLDLMLLGQLLSTVQLVKMHLAAGEEVRAVGLWTELYRSVVQLFTASEALLAQSEVMQKHVGLWTAYTRLCWGAGVLTLDLLIRQGYPGYADMVAGQLVERVQAFKRHLNELLSSPSAGDWLSLEHRETLQELREVKRRFSARQDALAQGFFAQLHAHSAPKAEPYPVSAFGTGRPSSGQPPLV